MPAPVLVDQHLGESFGRMIGEGGDLAPERFEKGRHRRRRRHLASSVVVPKAKADDPRLAR
jgi:hypothetical protein